MSPEQLKSRFDEIARSLWQCRQELDQLVPEVRVVTDQKAIGSILVDLTWAAEHCTTLGLHQIGEKLNDNAGYTE